MDFLLCGTGKCPLFFVNPFMLFQSASLAEWMVTFGTYKWPLSFVETFMLFQSTTNCKWLVTFRTGKWLLSCVDPFMIFKSPLSVNDWSHLEQADGVFHSLSKCHSNRVSCHILNRQVASLLCGTFHDFQITICKLLVTFGTGKLSPSCSLKVPLQLNALSHL